MPEVEIGRVKDFFVHPVVAGIQLTASLKVGDTIRIKGHTTDVEMVVESIQLDSAPLPEASAGQSIGIEVPDRVRRGDVVYRVVG